MSTTKLTMSSAGLVFLKSEEGIIEGLYDDPSGYCTYGIGHLVHKSSCYLLAAAASTPDVASYVKSKWPGTASETKYLDRIVRFSTKFGDLKKSAVGTGPGATAAQGLVESEANVLGTAIESLLKLKLHSFENAVAKTITIGLTQNEFDALVSFSYNVGTPAFGSSTLAKLINEGKFKSGDAKVRKAAISQIDAEFKKWRKSAGKVLKGLVSRREHEAALFLGDAEAQLKELESKTAAPIGQLTRPKGHIQSATSGFGNGLFTPKASIQPTTLPFSYPSNPQAPFCPSYPMLQLGMTKISH